MTLRVLFNTISRQSLLWFYPSLLLPCLVALFHELEMDVLNFAANSLMIEEDDGAIDQLCNETTCLYLNGLKFDRSNCTFWIPVNESQLNASNHHPLPEAQDNPLPTVVFISTLLGMVILATVMGNVFVIAAILFERNLRTVNNCLILSLAVADLLVACLIMPLGAVYEVNQAWTMGPTMCEIWTSCDVLCCTASILHLLAIAVDRYWAVTNIDYLRKRSLRQLSVMISLIWTTALIISFSPVFGWKDVDFQRRLEVDRTCLVNQNVSYQLFATCATFYVPLTAILILYWRIFNVAKKRIRHKPGAKISPTVKGSGNPALLTVEMTTTTTTTTTSSSQAHSDTPSSRNGIIGNRAPSPSTKKIQRDPLKSKRERKAAKTLVIITGVFVVCWLPFFIMAILMPLCAVCQPSGPVFSLFLWLGYVNSTLNPILYTVFSPDFRSAFRRFLLSIRRARHVI